MTKRVAKKIVGNGDVYQKYTATRVNTAFRMKGLTPPVRLHSAKPVNITVSKAQAVNLQAAITDWKNSPDFPITNAEVTFQAAAPTYEIVSEMTVAELKARAKELKIKGFSTMNKADLIKALLKA